MQNICPVESSSFLSYITFWWVNPLVVLGVKRPLQQKDMWDLSLENRTAEILKLFNKYWQKSVIRGMKFVRKDYAVGQVAGDDNEIRVHIISSLFKTFKGRLLLAALYKLIDSLLTFVNPIVLDFLITFVASDEPMWKGYVYASTMFFSSMAQSLFSSQYEYLIYNTGLRMRACMTSVVYKKVTLHLSNACFSMSNFMQSLKLSTSGRRDFTTGEIVNLMAVDTQRVIDYIHTINLLWSAPLQVGISLYLLWAQLGVATLSGVFVMIILVPINGVVTAKLRKLQVSIMKAKDKRTKLMNEILNGIKILKLYAWENSFVEQVRNIRDVEVDALKKQAYYAGGVTFAFSCAPFFVALASFATYVLIDPKNVLDPNKAFVSLSLFNILRIPLALLPILITSGAMFLVSVRRINKYLQGDELDENAVTHDNDPDNPITVSKASFSWSNTDEPVLHDINLQIKTNKLVAVVGQVGSGKSSILSAILGDMYKKKGSVNVSGSIAYVPQQAWIMNETLRQNILFTKSMDETKYKRVLSACALEPDLKILEGGDMCEIGEKGINLSGGQKQRVSLARAVYANADLYLFDDPLSAVDSHVGRHLFEQVIGPTGLLKNKTRVVVTHKITILPQCDEIIVMKDGFISERGSYKELLEKKGDFAEILVQFLAEHDEEIPEEDMSVIEEMKASVKPELERHISQISQSKSSLSGDSELRNRKSSVRSQDSDRKKSISKSPAKARLTESEQQQVGSIKFEVYKDYIKAVGVFGATVTVVSFMLANVFNVLSSLWLTAWSNDANDPQNFNNTAQRDYRLGVYGGLGSGETVFILFSSITLNLACLRASKVLHNGMIERILLAPMSFFDTTPLGRILNRFSKDIDSADVTLRFNLRMLISQFCRTVSSLVIISMETPIFLVTVIPLGIIYYMVQKYYVTTSRQLKRIESTTRSPIYSHFSETVTGSTSIRAYGASEQLIQECHNRIDINHSSYFSSIAANRWLETRLQFLGYIIIFLAAIFAVVLRDKLSPGIAGLSISYSLTITMTLNMLVRASSDVETNMVAVERCLEYNKTPVEAPQYIESKKPKDNWPQKGGIKLVDYSTRYRDGLKLVLNKINCEINPGEKIGIVGRTGAGKSSLTLALFRLIEPTEGTIIVDDVDVCEIGLHDLRSRLTIIPQDPVLFTGTLRMNLDPFSKYSDEQVWKSLELAHLKSFVASLGAGLSYEISEGGENLSVGQRQLVCLARALLRKSKILVLDEATAAVDYETDELIQATIRKEFENSSVVTIAHRLNTIMDYDRLIIVDNGSIIEFDSPKNLLENTQSYFYSMAKDSGLV
ncbi:multidrug resistance-associated protein 1-like protein [Leptotrombidium deliense]|uniref:ABC-type glutathione-S-conjugate transporter n=1 Tax=Leptotrombidium deliense TaxID=299467 RepID=A0A443STM3_9ACAR|nr:multidrug resistance-associated protein 1-like protein [Leptotrombidium deliense]